MFREAILAYLGVKPEESRKERTPGEIGWYCNGDCVSECSLMFGAALAKVCKTCPN